MVPSGSELTGSLRGWSCPSDSTTLPFAASSWESPWESRAPDDVGAQSSQICSWNTGASLDLYTLSIHAQCEIPLNEIFALEITWDFLYNYAVQCLIQIVWQLDHIMQFFNVGVADQPVDNLKHRTCFERCMHKAIFGCTSIGSNI
jgi:hypothetical protein